MSEKLTKWEQWINSEEGKRASEPSILVDPKKNLPYLKNRLWWAFHAQDFPIHGHMETKAESLLRECMRKPLPVRLKREIQTYLNEQNELQSQTQGGNGGNKTDPEKK
jgi:hypothetical protein